MTNHRDAPMLSDDVTATLKYLEHSDVQDAAPVFHASSGGGGNNQYDGLFTDQEVRIHNGRPRRNDFSLDQEGFVLVDHQSSVTDFYDSTQISQIYETEVQTLVHDLTGAARVHVFDHTFRTNSAKQRERKQVRDPVPIVHNDYTERSARQRVRDLFAPTEADALLADRFAIFNIWRSVAGVIEALPLALCDANSVSTDHLVPMERRAKDRVGEMQQAIFSPGHHWHYFPKMDRHEALVFKTFDSALDGRAKSSLHSAFEHPSTSPSAAPRESIETRVFAFFNNEGDG